MLEEAENPHTMENPYRKGEFRGTAENGICWMYKMMFGNDDMYFHREIMFPELYKKVSEFKTNGFLDGTEERIEALKQCIIETHP